MEPGPLPDGYCGMATSEAKENISGFVLAGGRSTRLGQDKAMLPWLHPGGSKEHGQTLLDHAITRLEHACDTVSICTDRNDLPHPNATIRDALPDSGPLGGIVAALEQSHTEWNMFLAVDLPLLPAEVLEALAACVMHVDLDADSTQSVSREQAVCIIPQVAGLLQPLCGLYHRALAQGLRRALQEGKRKVTTALQEAVRDVAVTPEFQPEWPLLRIVLWDAADFAKSKKISSSLRAEEWFLNVNTPEDWRRAQDLMSA